MNHNEEESVNLPTSILTKVYDCTGSPNGGNKGFFLLYVNELGQPSVASHTENDCVTMALTKLGETFFDKDLDI